MQLRLKQVGIIYRKGECALKALVLGWVTDLLKVILGLRAASIEIVVVNTEPERYFETVPGLEHKVPVALNLYRGWKMPKLRLSRFFLPFAPSVLGYFPLRRLASLIADMKPDFVFAHWGVGVLPEVALVKSVAPKLPVILNMETFPTASAPGLREKVELRLFKQMVSAIDALIIPTSQMAELIFELAPSLRKKPS